MALKGGDNLVMSRLGHKLPDMTKKKKIVFEEYDPAEVSKAPKPQDLSHSPTSQTEVASVLEASIDFTPSVSVQVPPASESEVPSFSEATVKAEAPSDLQATSLSDATAQIEVPSQNEATSLAEATSVIARTSLTEVTRKAAPVVTEATSEMEADAKTEVPSKSKATSKSEGTSISEVPTKEGFTRLNHTILEKLCQLDLGAREYRLVLYLIRQTLGWNREWVELSATDIERAMGWNNSQVWKTIPGLRDTHQCIIVRREEGSQKNFYSLNSKVFGRLLPSKKEVTSKLPVATELEAETAAETEVGTSFQTGSGEGDLNQRAEPISSRLKKGIKENLNKSLSLIEEFFQSVKSPERLKREREAFVSIQTANPDLSSRELLGCLNKAKTNSKIDSPFVYLAGGYLDKVLPVVRTEIEREIAKELFSKQLEVALDEFNRQLSEEQRTEMRDWIQKNHPDGYKLHDVELEQRAAYTWLSNKRPEIFSTIAL